MPETRMVAKLKATAGVTDLCGERIYPLSVPQGVTYPAIAYQQVGTATFNHSVGTCDFAIARFQVTSYAETYLAAKALNAAVKAALIGWTDGGGTPVIGSSSWQGDTDLAGGPEPGQDEYLRGVASDWTIKFKT